MTVNIQPDLDLITESVLQVVSAEAIYLFGSHAYGTPNHESDIDIYVVVPDETTEFGELYGDVLMILRKKKRRINLDMKFGHSARFHHRKNGPTLERAVAQKGTMLYG